MGLLSDPEYGSLKWVRILKKYHPLFSFILYFGGLAWFFVLACKEFNNETYFSENALLPGLATNEFTAEHTANQFHNEFLRELEDKYDDSAEMPVPWLVAKMSQLHLEVYTHNFTLNYPLGQGQVFKGTNVYGILRAPRTSSLEALVISAPYRPLSSHLKGTTAGVALMLAFAQFARPQKYWAKDIIFLITEHEQLGMQAWLEAYHGLQGEPGSFYSSLGSFHKPGMPTLDIGKLTGSQWAPDQNKCLDPGTLKGRSGSIQAAINLELHTPKIKYVAVKVEGLNGQLPNLDLVNLVLKLCMKAGIHQSFKSSYSWMRNRYKGDDWSAAIYTMLEMVQTQATGVPNGNHGLFHRFGIEAVTLEGRDADDVAATPPKVSALSSANFYRLGNALESIMRSMNNLLERFHQSYFFYLLSATNRFISIGQYMPSLCLMCIALLVRALGFWVTLQKDTDEETDTFTIGRKKSEVSRDKKSDVSGDKKSDMSGDKKSDVSGDKKSDLSGDKESDVSDDDKLNPASKEGDKSKKVEEISFSIVSMGANFLLVHLLGYFVMNSPFILSRIGATYLGLPSEQSVYYGLIVISVITSILVPYLPGLFGKMERTYEELLLVNILVLVELATACLAIGMHNYSLGLILATLYTPVALTVRVANDGFLSQPTSPSEDDTTQTITNSGQRKFSILRLLYGVMAFMEHLLVQLFNPLVLLLVGMVVYASLLFPDEGGSQLFGRASDASMHAIMFSIVDSMIYGNWLFNVVCLVVFPVWVIFRQIVQASYVDEAYTETSTNVQQN